MRQSNKKSCKYICRLCIIIIVCILWLGYPSAPFKGFILENILSPLFIAIFTLSWTKFRTGKNFRGKFDYFICAFGMFILLMCVIGQTYQGFNSEEAIWNLDKIILNNINKILTLFFIPLVVGYFTDRFVFELEKLEHSK